MIVIVNSIVVITGFPSIRTGLGFTATALPWVQNASFGLAALVVFYASANSAGAVGSPEAAKLTHQINMAITAGAVLLAAGPALIVIFVGRATATAASSQPR
jgi:hypothetical protein